MKKMRFYGLLIAAALGMGQALASPTCGFDGVITTGSAQAPGTWYTDRYNPAGFSGAGGVVTQTISSADSAGNRPSAYSSTFYNTQGRKCDTGVESVIGVSVDLFVPMSYAGMNQRVAGLWGTGYDVSNTLSGYPIIEFASNGTSGARFQGWNDASGWVEYGLPSGFLYDSWHKLSFELNGGNWDYKVDGNLLGSVDALGSTYLANTILQGYNAFTTEGSYDIEWRNLNFIEAKTTDVPEPGSLALLLPALALGGFVTRRKKGSKAAS